MIRSLVSLEENVWSGLVWSGLVWSGAIIHCRGVGSTSSSLLCVVRCDTVVGACRYGTTCVYVRTRQVLILAN